MLDLNGIPVVDNHCHPILLQQHMDTLLSAEEIDEQQAYRLAQQILLDTAYTVYGL